MKQMNDNFVAHVRHNSDGSWSTQSLQVHLNGVAQLAGTFAATFGNRDWGEILGYWHDLGKFLPDWQKYLRRKSGYDMDAHIEDFENRPNHSTAGALAAFDQVQQYSSEIQKIARLVAYSIAGHHAGLPDWDHDKAGGDLVNRLYKDPMSAIFDFKEIHELKLIHDAKRFLEMKLPKSAPLKIANAEEMDRGKEYLHLWQRMLFSCLVDADFLDTEAFMNPDRSGQRGNYLSLAQLKGRFDTFMEEKRPDTLINKKRGEILDQCRLKAKCAPGFFSLNVPTGGGKTLSSMAFALEHAILYDKSRVIMAIPYTSIIEQTAKVYKYGTDDDDEIETRLRNGRVLFGEDQVLEHHSNLDPDKDTHRSRLASENWDAPIVVTTNVQLFESLFASRPSACRKLHNLANSVIILDEVQMLPPEYLRPILSVLRGLVEYFGVTVVLMTATQPALEGKIGSQPNEFDGLANVAHIIDNPDKLARDFQRVDLVMPKTPDERSEWKQIADDLKKHNQILCIVNTRSDCRSLHSEMPEGTIHLSGYMCGEERSEIISDIKAKLKNGEPIRVISTQLVEAGVDIDFPIVYRALAGLDSIAQAAGRCNRNKMASEGKLGKVIIFNPPKSAPMGLLRKGEDACRSILRAHCIKELTPEIFKEYFRQFFPNVNDFDKPRFIERLVKEAGNFKFQFRTLAQDFKLIDNEEQKSIVVFYENKKTGNNSEEWIRKLRFAGPSKHTNRKLQRFIVNVPKKMFDHILARHYLEEIHGYWVQSYSFLYKPGLGLLGYEDKPNFDELIV